MDWRTHRDTAERQKNPVYSNKVYISDARFISPIKGHMYGAMFTETTFLQLQTFRPDPCNYFRQTDLALELCQRL